MNHSESVHVGAICPPLQFGPGRSFALRSSPGEALVFAISSFFDFDPEHCNRIRTELRGLGATLYLFVDTGLWRFHADKDVECMIGTNELTEAICTSVRATFGLLSETQEPDKFALFVMDGQLRVRFVRYGSAADSQGSTRLLEGLSAAVEVVHPNARWQLSRREGHG